MSRLAPTRPGRHRHRRVLAAVLLVAVTALGLATASAVESEPRNLPNEAPAHRLYEADSGFRPVVDGFSFPNYGDDPPGGGAPIGLDAQALQRMFPDDDVCFSGAGGADCTLSPSGQMWLEIVNQAMDGGHCEGFAALAARFYTGGASPADLEPGAVTTADLDGADPAVQREIAYWWATQTVAPTSTDTLKDLTPNEVLSTLRQAMAEPQTAANTYTIGILDKAAGHAVNPVATQDRGDGLWWILVYDNNHPDILRPIEIDTVANTWRYNLSTNPSETESEWSGDATTHSLQLTPTDVRERPQVCPWCRVGTGTSSFLLAGEGSDLRALDVYVTDTNTGQRSGRIDGEIVEEIPGGHVVVPTSSDPLDSQPAPLIDVPAELNLRLTITAPDDLAGSTDLQMAMLGAYDVYLDGLALTAGQTSTVELPTDAGSVTVASPGATTPGITLGTSPTDDPDANYVIRVQGHDMAGPGETTITSTESDQLMVITSVTGTFDVGLELHRPDQAVERLVLEGALFDTQGGEAAVLTTIGSLFSWTGQPTFAAQIDPGAVAVELTRPPG